jgi:hypothetical protein
MLGMSSLLTWGKCSRLMWTRGPVCCVWDVSVLTSVHGLGTGVDVGVATPKLFFLECRSFLLVRKCYRLVWCTASGPVCSVWLFGFR